MELSNENQNPITQSTTISTRKSLTYMENDFSDAGELSSTAKDKAVQLTASNPSTLSVLNGSARIWAISKLEAAKLDPLTWKHADEILTALPASEEAHKTREGAQTLNPTPGTLLNQSRLPLVLEESLILEGMTLVETQSAGKPTSDGPELSELRQHAWAKVYNYYISRLDKLKITCDDMNQIRDLPAFTPEDYALLGTLNMAKGTGRGWEVVIDDLSCPECVAELRARRQNFNVRMTRKETPPSS